MRQRLFAATVPFGVLLCVSVAVSPVGASVRAPSVNAAAFKGNGNLAFISNGSLYVLDGTTGSLVRVAIGGLTPGGPHYSSNGKWLAFVAAPPQTATPSAPGSTTLWIANGDGSDPHKINGLTNPVILGWSPSADSLAVTTSASFSMSVWLVAPGGITRRVAMADEITGAVWSPNGSELAVASSNHGPHWSTTLAAYSAGDGKPAVWLTSNAKTKLNGIKGFYVEPVGWFSKWGIVFWTISVGMLYDDVSLCDGGTPMDVIARPGASSHELGETMSCGSVGPAAGSPKGELAITDNTNGNGRPIWQGEQVEVCDLSKISCSALATSTSFVSLDPNWSPNGKTLAYVEGPSSKSLRISVQGWYNSQELFLYQPATQAKTEVPLAKGATVPVWSKNGKELLYVSNDGLWIDQVVGGTPIEIASPLYPPSELNGAPVPVTDAQISYYGQVGWDLFSWSSPRGG